MIRSVNLNDAERIVDIYNIYVLDTVITFEQDIVSSEVMSARIEQVMSQGLPWLVAESEGQVVGYAYATPWKERTAYRYTVEVTVYLSQQEKQRGWGTQLYKELFNRLKQHGMNIAIGGITLPNDASIALHEKFGMYKVAHFKQVGFKFDQWLDVGYWQKELT